MGGWSVDEGDVNGFEILWDFNQGLEWEINNLKWCSPNSVYSVPITFGLQKEVEKKEEGKGKKKITKEIKKKKKGRYPFLLCPFCLGKARVCHLPPSHNLHVTCSGPLSPHGRG